ncbi:hypothetical protein FRC14_004063 [Serendipita sp. 396]|nr:hypothetical protein FRC14_004063 [Serendipita sp. 396]KAG8780953.1 hypothetical protein FRC15_009135 [Serendipita sp. 397]KAG8850663.1 hypothetical protein FRB91_008862 [Serendipita sp. 411]KAG8867064.1 hypothetical protein FRC20_006798 [Serendipita sp. 405]
MSSGATSFRQALNNEFQGTRLIEYIEDRSGALHDPVWRVIVFIDKIEYGSGSAKNKNDAKEEAAKNAYLRLKKPH